MFDLIKFVTLAAGIKHAKGSYSGSKHEAAVEALIVQCGGVERPRGSVLKPGEYISQPNNKNNNPDFHVCLANGEIQEIEAKSATDTKKPTYNEVVAKRQCIYVFSSKKADQTVVFMGDDMITPERRARWEQFTSAIKKLTNEFNDLDYDDHAYSRIMWNNRRMKYFDPTTKARLTQNAINYATSKVGPATNLPGDAIPLGDNITLQAPTLDLPLFQGLVNA